MKLECISPIRVRSVSRFSEAGARFERRLEGFLCAIQICKETLEKLGGGENRAARNVVGTGPVADLLPGSPPHKRFFRAAPCNLAARFVLGCCNRPRMNRTGPNATRGLVRPEQIARLHSGGALRKNGQATGDPFFFREDSKQSSKPSGEFRGRAKDHEYGCQTLSGPLGAFRTRAATGHSVLVFNSVSVESELLGGILLLV